MSALYTPIPIQPSAPDAERELNDAFDSEDHDDNILHESTPLNQTGDAVNPIPGAYDFEREYDFPPPGSPPGPTSRALPNDYGNSNGLMPSSPVRNSQRRAGPSFFRRAVGALLPSHYVRVPTEAQPSRTIGGGMDNDGVFANVMAKPQRSQVVRTENGEVYVVPEDSNHKDIPPVSIILFFFHDPPAHQKPQSYADAQADAVPPYWETTIHAPASRDPNADMIIGDMPTGSLWVFAANCVISFFFQFVGFLLTYLLHTSHAGKYGSRAGLGITLIQFGFYSRSAEPAPDGAQLEVEKPKDASTSPTGDEEMLPTVSSRDWLAFLFMTIGMFFKFLLK